MGLGKGMGRGRGRGMGRRCAGGAVASPVQHGHADNHEVGLIAHKTREVQTAGADRFAPKHGASDCEKRKPSKMIAVIDEERCICCGLCINFCPEEAISISSEMKIDASRCSGCGSCAAECPYEAISLSADGKHPAVHGAHNRPAASTGA